MYCEIFPLKRNLKQNESSILKTFNFLKNWVFWKTILYLIKITVILFAIILTIVKTIENIKKISLSSKGSLFP